MRDKIPPPPELPPDMLIKEGEFPPEYPTAPRRSEVPNWKSLIKLGFWAGVGWWLATAVTTLFDYGVVMLLQVTMSVMTGQPV